MPSPGRVFLRTELLDKLYPNGEMVIDRVIDVHIGKVRSVSERDRQSADCKILVLRSRATSCRSCSSPSKTGKVEIGFRHSDWFSRSTNMKNSQ